MRQIIRFGILGILLAGLFSCAYDLNAPPTGELADIYERKYLPEPYLESFVVEAPCVMVPAFNSERTNYALALPPGEDWVSLSAKARSPHATISIDGERISAEFSASVKPGGDRMTVRCIDRDGLSKYDYQFNIIRMTGHESSDSSLHGLELFADNKSQINFSESVLSYHCEVPFDTKTAFLTAWPNDPNSEMYVNGVLVKSGDELEIILDLGENEIEVLVTAEDFSATSYLITLERPTPAFFDLLISEWGTGTTDQHYIEVWNSGSRTVKITTSFNIVLGANPSVVSLTAWGTGNGVDTYKILSYNSAYIEPGEVFIIVEKGLESTDIDAIAKPNKNYTMPADTKIFVSSESTLIGANKRLHDNRALLQEGDYQWSHTPDPDAMVEAGLTSTYTKLRPGFNPLEDDYSDPSFWVSGSKTSTPSPGTLE